MSSIKGLIIEGETVFEGLTDSHDDYENRTDAVDAVYYAATKLLESESDCGIVISKVDGVIEIKHENNNG